MVNLAGLSLLEHSYGKFKGQAWITNSFIFQLFVHLWPVIQCLKLCIITIQRAMRSHWKTVVTISLCCKLLNVLFVIGQKNVSLMD